MWPHLLHACALPEFRMFRLHSAQLGLCSAQLLAARPPQAKPTEKHNSRATISEQPALGPALRRFTSHNTTFTQPNSFCGFCPSQNTLVQSPNVFLAWPDSDRLSIMTFSEIGPGSLKCNAFDRCLSLQLHKSRYTEWKAGAALKELGVVAFRANLLGNIRFYQLSLLSEHLWLQW